MYTWAPVKPAIKEAEYNIVSILLEGGDDVSLELSVQRHQEPSIVVPLDISALDSETCFSIMEHLIYEVEHQQKRYAELRKEDGESYLRYKRHLAYQMDYEYDTEYPLTYRQEDMSDIARDMGLIRKKSEQ